MTSDEPFSWIISLADLTGGELTQSRRLSPAERQALAERAAIESVGALTATAKVRQWSGGVIVEVSFGADVTQACVVTLEPVPGKVRDQFIVRYVPDAFIDRTEKREVEVTPEEDDPPEPLEGDRFDLAPVVTEHFILALDPYPRAPGATLPSELAQEPEAASPFEVLKDLKDKI